VNRSSKNATCITARGCLLGLALGMVTLLTACSGGGDVGLGSGQDPDPATVDFPIFYIRHQIPMEDGQIAQDNVTRVRPFVEDQDDVEDSEQYSATLWKRDRASPGAPETELTARLRVAPMGDPADRYDIKDLAVSPDGLKVAFAMRGPLGDFDEDETPTWNIWEYDIATDDLHRVIRSDIVAEDGQDLAPAYLPDGRILFSSTRQRQAKAILLDENKQQFEATNETRNESAFVLHVMNGDGTDVHQITFNPSSDLYSSVMQDGRVLFTRWDRSAGRDRLDLYTTNPDGTDTQLYYGSLDESHEVGTPVPLPTNPPTPGPSVEFVRAREMSDGKLMVLARERTNVDFGGNLLIIDGKNFVENTQALLASAGMPGPATTPATLNLVSTIPGPSKGGRFQSGFPLWDGTGRILVSWSQCRLLDVGGTDPTRIVPCDDARLLDPNVPPQAAPPLYSIWMFNPSQNTILPIMPPVEGVMVTEAIAAQPRVPLPAVIVDKKAPGTLNPDYVSESVGILNIRSVYEIMGVSRARVITGPSTLAAISDPSNAAYPQREIRFVRIEKRVSIPDDDNIADPDNSAFGGSNIMREIVAYAPVEPDGSIQMKVPANIAFELSLLDQNARMISRHNGWLTVRPGEVLECTGCHARDPQNPRSHGRKGSFAAAYTGASGAGVAWPGAVNTVSPEPGDTMAMARARVGSSCIDGNMIEHCGAQSLNPSANVVYDEIWKPAAPLTDSFAFTYQNLNTRSPASPGCFPWTTTCRITIHYADIATRPGHILPLWTFDRPASLLPGAPTGIDTNNDGVLEPTYTCASCHSRTDVVNALQLPAASLELLPGAQCTNDALRDLTYCQLLEPRDELVIDNGAVVTRQSLVPLDANGQPTIIIPLLPNSMNANSSRSSRFFQVMNTAPHTGMLSPAELRLLSEWLDIGAQYYNDPFPPTPQN